MYSNANKWYSWTRPLLFNSIHVTHAHTHTVCHISLRMKATCSLSFRSKVAGIGKEGTCIQTVQNLHIKVELKSRHTYACRTLPDFISTHLILFFFWAEILCEVRSLKDVNTPVRRVFNDQMFLITLHLSWITLKATVNQNRGWYNCLNDWIKYTVKHNNVIART